MSKIILVIFLFVGFLPNILFAKSDLTLRTQLGFHSGNYPHGFWNTRSECYVLFQQVKTSSIRIIIRDRDYETKYDQVFTGINLDAPISYNREGIVGEVISGDNSKVTISTAYLNRGFHRMQELEGPYIDSVKSESFSCSMMSGGELLRPYFERMGRMELFRKVFSDIYF